MNYPRTNYEMTDDDLKELMEASKPTPCFMIGHYSPPSPQENSNRAWAHLAKKMGFDYMTVQPIQGKGVKFFSAVPNETESQRVERLTKEAEEKKASDIKRLEDEIAAKQVELNKLRMD